MAIQTAEIASKRANGKSQTARPKMIQRFFLYRVRVGRRRLAINQQFQLPADVFPYAAKAGFTIGNFTAMVTGGAFNNFIFKGFVEKRGWHNDCAVE